MNRVPRRLIAGMLVLLTGLACAAGFAAPQDEPVPGDATPDVSYTLRTALTDGRLAFVGATGSIKGQVNPDLSAPEGAIVRIKLINGDGVIHDIVVPEFGADSGKVSTRGAVTTIVFKADKNGTFEYYCSLPGHKAMGMLGRLIVGEAREASADDTGTIAQDPTAVGQPVGTRLGMSHWIWKLVRSSPALPMARATATGPSMARFPAPCCVFGSATG